jgi:hypothetical protein
MAARTLSAQRRYYGMEPMQLLQATARVLTRVAGLPPERARVSGRSVQQDFALDTVQGQALVENFVEDGLLRRHAERRGDYQLTPRFLEFASARVVEPMPRAKARQLVSAASRLAERINAEWARNPLEVDALAVSGSYMSRSAELPELTLGIIVRPRSAARRFRFFRRVNADEGASRIQNEFRDMSSFVNAYIAIDTQGILRPFSVIFKAEAQD